jgi:mediator of RNA polymerase II transcription subunit 6
MATFNGAPMDEIQWRLEEAVAHFGGIRAENIHLYFLASPFCESSSNNKALENQLRFQPDSYHILQDRTAFESKLRQLNSGVEYIVTDGPKQTTPNMNPVWTIRKQRRTKAPKPLDSKEPSRLDRIDILGTYYAIGENIYQAPSVLDILSNRLVSTV